MKLSASNIGWSAEQDDLVMRYMADHGFSGLEVAPTRVFPDKPYDDLSRASCYAAKIKEEYGLSICSMQSIWYGQTQKIAESAENREYLLRYTQKAIQFADAVGCTNLVFGCPRNRSTAHAGEAQIIDEFLRQCAELALPYGVVIALEANPTIYHTNYINTTPQAIELIKTLNHPCLKLNLDFGTVIENNEALDWIKKDGNLIYHVHISEPNLLPIQERAEHNELIYWLSQCGYSGFISVEMGSNGNLQRSLEYIEGITDEKRSRFADLSFKM